MLALWALDYSNSWIKAFLSATKIFLVQGKWIGSAGVQGKKLENVNPKISKSLESHSFSLNCPQVGLSMVLACKFYVLFFWGVHLGSL